MTRYQQFVELVRYQLLETRLLYVLKAFTPREDDRNMESGIVPLAIATALPEHVIPVNVLGAALEFVEMFSDVDENHLPKEVVPWFAQHLENEKKTIGDLLSQMSNS
jgi:hypothetical protein